jgi:hypothetical protein
MISTTADRGTYGNANNIGSLVGVGSLEARACDHNFQPQRRQCSYGTVERILDKGVQVNVRNVSQDALFVTRVSRVSRTRQH